MAAMYTDQDGCSSLSSSISIHKTEEVTENTININITQNVKIYRVITRCMQTLSNANTFPLVLRLRAVGRAITKSVSIVETLKSKLILTDEMDIQEILEQKNTLSSIQILGDDDNTVDRNPSDIEMDVEEEERDNYKQSNDSKQKMKSVLEILLILKKPCSFSKDYDK